MLQRLVRSMVSTDPRPYFTVRRAVVVQLLVVVRADVAAGKHVFQMLGEFGVNRHHVFEVPVHRAFLHHQNLAVALDDGGFDLADFFVHQNFVGQIAVENLLTDFGHALAGTANRSRAASPAAASTFRRT